MTTREERQQVLRMVADGKITAEEGSRLLAALSGGASPEAATSTATTSAAADEQPQEIPQPQPEPQQEAHTPEQDVIPPPLPIDTKTPDTRRWWQVPF